MDMIKAKLQHVLSIRCKNYKAAELVASVDSIALTNSGSMSAVTVSYLFQEKCLDASIKLY